MTQKYIFDLKILFFDSKISDTILINFDLYKHWYFRLKIFWHNFDQFRSYKHSFFDSKFRLLKIFVFLTRNLDYYKRSHIWLIRNEKIIFWLEISITSNFDIFDSKLIIFQLYEIDDESGRKDFLDELFTFMQKRGKKLLFIIKKITQ